MFQNKIIKILTFFIIYMSFFSYTSFSSEKNDNFYSLGIGVWFHENEGDFKRFNNIEDSTYEQTFIDNFSWGKSINIAYRTLVIDFKDSKLTFIKDPGNFRIKSIKQINKNIFNVIIYFFSEDLLKDLYEYENLKITINVKIMIIDCDNKLFKGKYFKIGGPGIPLFNEQVNKNYFPTIDNLRFRETPTLDGKFIRMLTKKDKLELLEKGKDKTIIETKYT